MMVTSNVEESGEEEMIASNTFDKAKDKETIKDVITSTTNNPPKPTPVPNRSYNLPKPSKVEGACQCKVPPKPTPAPNRSYKLPEQSRRSLPVQSVQSGKETIVNIPEQRERSTIVAKRSSGRNPSEQNGTREEGSDDSWLLAVSIIFVALYAFSVYLINQSYNNFNKNNFNKDKRPDTAAFAFNEDKRPDTGDIANLVICFCLNSYAAGMVYLLIGIYFYKKYRIFC